MVVLVVQLHHVLAEVVERSDVSVFVGEEIGDLFEFCMGLKAREDKSVFTESGGDCGVGFLSESFGNRLVESAGGLSDERAASGRGEVVGGVSTGVEYFTSCGIEEGVVEVEIEVVVGVSEGGGSGVSGYNPLGMDRTGMGRMGVMGVIEGVEGFGEGFIVEGGEGFLDGGRASRPQAKKSCTSREPPRMLRDESPSFIWAAVLRAVTSMPKLSLIHLGSIS